MHLPPSSYGNLFRSISYDLHSNNHPGGYCYSCSINSESDEVLTQDEKKAPPESILNIVVEQPTTELIEGSNIFPWAAQYALYCSQMKAKEGEPSTQIIKYTKFDLATEYAIFFNLKVAKEIDEKLKEFSPKNRSDIDFRSDNVDHIFLEESYPNSEKPKKVGETLSVSMSEIKKSISDLHEMRQPKDSSSEGMARCITLHSHQINVIYIPPSPSTIIQNSTLKTFSEAKDRIYKNISESTKNSTLKSRITTVSPKAQSEMLHNLDFFDPNDID